MELAFVPSAPADNYFKIIMGSATEPNINILIFTICVAKRLKHGIMRWWCLDRRGDGSWVVPRIPSCLQSCVVLV